jgi:UDP-N-acetylmuramoyl-tripeptide--D-alanyl-D-alanine ligase
MTESLRNFSTFEGSKTIIIGDMLELGEESAKEHLAMFELAKSLDFDEIITVGKLFQQCNNHLAFEKSEELGNYIKENPISNKNILLKGSRGIALEKILEFL